MLGSLLTKDQSTQLAGAVPGHILGKQRIRGNVRLILSLSAMADQGLYMAPAAVEHANSKVSYTLVLLASLIACLSSCVKFMPYPQGTLTRSFVLLEPRQQPMVYKRQHAAGYSSLLQGVFRCDSGVPCQQVPAPLAQAV